MSVSQKSHQAQNLHSPIDRNASIVGVPSFPQLYHWDCGLACLAMAFSYLEESASPIYASSIQSLVKKFPTTDTMEPKEKWQQLLGTCWGKMNETYLKKLQPIREEVKEPLKAESTSLITSIWTIDLLGLFFEVLQKNDQIMKENVCFSTVNLGVDESYKNLEYYSSNYCQDTPRVMERFEEALHRNWKIMKNHYSIESLFQILSSGQYLIICLVDAMKLRCSCCIVNNAVEACSEKCSCCTKPSNSVHSNTGNCLSCCPRCCPSIPYAGHYVLLCGTDTVNQTVLYRNPGAPYGSMCVESIISFDAARCATGTDEDLIIVQVN